MKKIILTTLATIAVASGAFAQGSITGVQGTWSADGVTTPGANASNPALADGSLYYTGSVALELFYAPTSSVNQAQITAINALDGTAGGGAAARALLTTDGFTLVSATDLSQSPVAGSVSYAVSTGDFTGADPNQVNLMSPTVTSATAWIAMYLVGNAADAFNGFSGVLAFQQNTGGNPYTTPIGLASAMTQDPTGLNLVLTTAVPEPATIALMGLGGASLLLFRRRKV